ncbi:MAG: TonB family protein [Terracidiphilus sp.]|jgi:TonB family protein
MRCFWIIALFLTLVAINGKAQQTTPTADTPQPASYPAKEKINPPTVINNVAAEFSEEARQKRIGGVCLVSITVDTNGEPQDIKLVRCTDPSFEETSLDAAKQYRFKPATTLEGNPVAAKVFVEVAYHSYGASDPGMPIRYTFSSPPGITSSEAGADGVYPLTNVPAGPILTKFSDEGYRKVAYWSTSLSACDILLTISAKGKASDPQVIHCERPELEKPAVQSLLKSHYKPGKVNGKSVPIRASIHLQYGGSPSKPQ